MKRYKVLEDNSGDYYSVLANSKANAIDKLAYAYRNGNFIYAEEESLENKKTVLRKKRGKRKLSRVKSLVKNRWIPTKNYKNTFKNANRLARYVIKVVGMKYTTYYKSFSDFKYKRNGKKY